jgi:hypothetical protein
MYTKLRGMTAEEIERFRDKELGSQRLTLEEFRAAVRLGGLKEIRVKAEGSELVVEASSRSGVTMPMAKARGRGMRRFRSTDSVLTVLKEMGVQEAVMDMRNWTPRETPRFAAKRPDVSARLAEGHAAARAGRPYLPKGIAQRNREGMISMVRVMRENKLEVPEEYLRMAGLI